jgi:hypothetical protein
MPSSIPELELNIQDGGLGLLPADASAIHAKLGVCSASADKAGELFYITSIEQLEALGTGPLVEAAAQALTVAGGPVICAPVRASVPGHVGAVTSIAAGEGSVSVSVTAGAEGPRDAYQLLVRITRKAVTIGANTGAFRYSLDGGRTWSRERALLATYSIPDTDLTLTFTDAALAGSTQPTSFEANDLYSVRCVGPGFVWDDVEDALQGFIESPYEFAFLHIVGSPGPALGAVTRSAEDSGRTLPLVTVDGEPSVYGYFEIEVTREGVRQGDPQIVETARAAPAGLNVTLARATPWTDPVTDVVITITDITAGAEKFKYKIGSAPEVTNVSFTPGGAAVGLGGSGLGATFPTGTYSASPSQSWTFRVSPVAKARITFADSWKENGETEIELAPSVALLIEDGSSTGLETGLTAHFPVGPYLLGDTFAFDTAALPANTVAANALEAGRIADEIRLALKRFVFVLTEAPAEIPDRALREAFQAVPVISDRAMVAAGGCMLRSPISGQIAERSAGWPLAARIAAVPIHEDVGRVASGPLKNVLAITRDENLGGVGDEFAPLDALGFSTLRTIVGLPGFYLTAGRMLVPPTSDFRHVQHRRVMDEACRLVRTLLLQRLNDDVKVSADTGFIDEVEARAIETPVNSALRTRFLVPGHVSAISFTLSRTDNLLSTSTLTGKVRIVPLGYLRGIEVTIGFNNPALSA